MKYFTGSYIRLKIFFFIGCILAGSLCSKAQSDPTHKFLYIPTANDGPDNSANEEETVTAPDSNQYKASSPHKLYKFIYADFGTSVLNSTIDGKAYLANGLTGAVSGQIACKIKTSNINNHVFLSAGLELKNLNCTYSYPDTTRESDALHDNLHFWYVGIPVMFQLVNTRHIPGNDHDVNFYIQAGITFAAKISVSETMDNRPGPVEDPNQNYAAINFQPFLSAGISYTAKRKVWLIGPFVTYTSNNISNLSGYTENLTSYGIRVTEMFFK